MRLSSTFAAISKTFQIEFEDLAKEIEHRGESGEARELAFRGLLQKYLPKRIAIDSGFVIDALGGQSAQMDVVIYDKTVGAAFEVSGTNFYPCETVIAVGEVKTAISSVERLRGALANVASAKRLDRSNRGTNRPITGPGYSLEPMPFDPHNNHRDQIFGFVFTGRSMKQDTVIAELQRWQSLEPADAWPNVYCDFNAFVISYFSENLTTSAMDARGMYCTTAKERDALLLLMFALLATFVNEAHVARPNYFDYACIASTDHDSYPLGARS